jgi:glucose-6-phosphate isomerase
MTTGALFEFGGVKVKPAVRMLADLRGVLYDPTWASKAGDVPLYFMYRDLASSKEDRKLITENRLRYDITVIPPRMLGSEYVKTAGHYHPLAPGQEVSYPELYQVLEGEAHYLLQKSDGDKITDIVLVKAGKGDSVLIPPGYGHVTINPSNVALKMADWVCRDFESEYSSYRKKKGAAYFELKDGRLAANKSYESLPEVRFFGPTNFEEFGLKKGKDIYSLVGDIQKLDYLKNPGKYMHLFDLLFKL